MQPWCAEKLYGVFTCGLHPAAFLDYEFGCWDGPGEAILVSPQLCIAVDSSGRLPELGNTRGMQKIAL